jgi:protein-S-isoprenylcysteine O-methyltransferase Ste14
MNEHIFFNWFMGGWIFLAVLSFCSLFFITAPYGKFTRDGFGPTLNRSIGWLIMESPSFLLMIVFFIVGDRHANPLAIIFLLMWEIHYVNRTFIFPFRMRGAKQGITVVTVILGVFFNFGNGYLNGRYLFTLAEPYGLEWIKDPRFIIGVILFFVGYSINMHSDSVLRALRKPGETGYKIPQKGIFRYVTSANYFGEIVEWTGFAIATWSPGALVFLIWTAANLVPRAVSQHAWYKKEFPDYPSTRRILIPYIF